jgi:hypothetical protein
MGMSNEDYELMSLHPQKRFKKHNRPPESLIPFVIPVADDLA